MSLGSACGPVFDGRCWASFAESDSALHEAAQKGDLQALENLLDAAAETDDAKVVSSISERNPLGCTPLRLAAAGGHVDCLKLLVQHGADVNVPDIKAQTPLMMAVKNQHIKCVYALLVAGANPNGDARSLCSPIYMAALNGYKDILEELLRFGADPDTSQLRVGTYDTTPTYIALVYDHLDCFRSLFLAGADPEGTSWGRTEGPTPGFTSFYHVAVKHNARPVYVWLLRALGASIYRRDSRSRLACDVISVDNASSNLIRQLLGSPLSLQHCCRIVIRRHLGCKRQVAVNCLPVPNRLLAYLNFSDI